MNSNIDFYMSIYGVSVPIRVTGFWLSALGCTKQGFMIQECRHYCWFMLLLHWSGHEGIVHHNHLWCLIDVFCWWDHFMLTVCLEGSNYHQYRILFRQAVRYIPHALFWYWVLLRENFFVFICRCIHMQDFLFWGLTEHETRRWEIIPFFGGDSHQVPAWYILNIHQFLWFYYFTRWLVPSFPFFVVLNTYA